MDNDIQRWLNTILVQKIPAGVVAFCFNLYDDGNHSWSMEMVGTDYVDLLEEDWPCQEVTTLETRSNPFRWYSEQTWDNVLKDVTLALQEYLANGRYHYVLKEYQAVAVGFVDGNLALLYIKE